MSLNTGQLGKQKGLTLKGLLRSYGSDLGKNLLVFWHLPKGVVGSNQNSECLMNFIFLASFDIHLNWLLIQIKTFKISYFLEVGYFSKNGGRIVDPNLICLMDFVAWGWIFSKDRGWGCGGETHSKISRKRVFCWLE